MFFKILLIGILFTILMFFIDVLFPKIKKKYKRYKEIEQREKRRDTFRKKMEELEIK